MTGEQIKSLCAKNAITFIPHHTCAICGAPTGWYLFHRWPEYEVCFSGNCYCCASFLNIHPATWDDIAKWVCGKDGSLLKEYQWINKL